jgi:hypothetical protein
VGLEHEQIQNSERRQSHSCEEQEAGAEADMVNDGAGDDLAQGRAFVVTDASGSGACFISSLDIILMVRHRPEVVTIALLVRILRQRGAIPKVWAIREGTSGFAP